MIQIYNDDCLEVWKEIIIDGKNTGWKISNNGRVQHPDGSYGFGCKRPDGYHEIKINQEKCYKVHRLIAEYFIPNPENKPEVDHIDGNKSNNCIKNLRWCTHKENMNNPITLKELNKNSLIHAEKYSKKCRCIETGEVFNSASDARRKYNNNNIASALIGRRRTAGGYHWEYVKEE